MDYIAALIITLIAGKILAELYRGIKPQPVGRACNPPQNIYYSAESIVALMYKYWRWRMDHARTIDEGGDCFVYASESVDHFVRIVEKSMAAARAESGSGQRGDAQAIRHSDNVIPFKVE